MAAQKGRDLLVRIAAVPGEDPPTAYNTVAGLRARSIRFNADLVDATTAESPQAWRELLEGAGLKRVDVRGDGLFVDAASDLRLREAFFNQETAAFELVAPGFRCDDRPFHRLTPCLCGGASRRSDILHNVGLCWRNHFFSNKLRTSTMTNSISINGARGEIKVMIDGSPYRLCLTLGALAEIETALGCVFYRGSGWAS